MVGVVELVALLKMCGRCDVAVMVVFCCCMRVVDSCSSGDVQKSIDDEI